MTSQTTKPSPAPAITLGLDDAEFRLRKRCHALMALIDGAADQLTTACHHLNDHDLADRVDSII